MSLMPEKQQQRIAYWLDQLEHALQAGSTTPWAHDEHDEQPVYLLRAETPRGSAVARLLLSWKMSRRKKTGDWIKPRPPSLMAEYALVSERADQGLSPDQECVRILQGFQEGAAQRLGGKSPAAAEMTVQGEVGRFVLQKCAATGRLFWQDEEGVIASPPLRWKEDTARLSWSWQAAQGVVASHALWQLRVGVQQGEEGPAQPLSPTLHLFVGPPTLYVDVQRQCCGMLQLPDALDAALLAVLLDAPALPEEAFRADNGHLAQRLAPRLHTLPPGIELPEAWPRCRPQPVLSLHPVPVPQRPQLGLVQARLGFDYQGLKGCWAGRSATVSVALPEGRTVLLTRDLEAEQQAVRSLTTLGLEPHDEAGYVCRDTSVWLEWAATDWQPLRQAGFALELAPELSHWVHTVESVDIHLTQEGLDDEVDARTDQMPEGREVGEGTRAPAWFALSLGIEINGQRHNVLPWLPDWLAQVQDGPEGPELPPWLWQEQADGRWLRLPSAPLRPWLTALLELVQERRFAGERLRLSSVEALRMASVMELRQGQTWHGMQQLHAMLTQLAAGAALPQTQLPKGLLAQLRPYQRQGLDWLQFLRQHQLGGILADDMGLGKTLQTLAHLLCEQEAGRLDRPCLVIAPVSLLGNWRREAARFAPSLRTHVWHGLERHAGTFVEACDLLIAPYSLLQRDRQRWLQQRWHVVVLDEAQHIKNASSQTAQVVRGLDARQRIALSGTPLENHLGELWSLFHFVMPGFLGSQKRFNELFRFPIEKQSDHAALQRLRQRITPFVLRRTKATVATELPASIESVTSVHLSGAQADLYETIRLATEKTVRDALAEKGLARAQIQLLDALLKLRQVCCDPRLVKNSVQATRVKTSAKLELLMELLTELVGQGRRVLVFSQFTSMLALIETELERAGLPWTKLTGQTRQRDAAIERFTSGQVPIFLISLKAGGTGLNLPQADTVIHYDPWWNPAVVEQATGRAHRIGQERQVMVYKLVAEGTIEERMLALQERKAALAKGLLAGAAGREQPMFSEEDVAELLRPLDG